MRRLFVSLLILGVLAGAGVFVWQRGVPGLARAHHGPTPVDEAFGREPAGSGGEGGFFFSSVYLSDLDPSGPPVQAAGRVVSLNPFNPQVAPRIFDTSTGMLIEVEEVAADLPDAKIERVLSLGAFAGDYAAARAQVRRGEQVTELWGYVNRQGKWVVGPRFVKADAPVNQWAKVDGGIVDLETGRAVAMPSGSVLCDEPLHRLGHDLWLCLNPSGKEPQPGWWLLAAGSGQLVRLPLRPSAGQWGDGAWILLEDGSWLERGSNKLEPAPESAVAGRELLPGVARVEMKVGDRNVFAVWDRTQGVFLAANLVAAEPLTRELFVACESGNPAQLLVRHGTDRPYPLDGAGDPRCGLMDKAGQWRVKAEYQHFYQLDGAVVFRNGREWCLLGGGASPVCGTQVPAPMLSGGLWLDADGTFDYEQHAGRYGYRDAGGAIRISFLFDAATPYVGKVAAVQRLETPGLIDEAGHWLTPAPAGDTVATSASCRGSCWGLVNRKGEWIVPPIFDEVVSGPVPDQFWVKNETTRKFVLVDDRGRRLQESDASKAQLSGRGPVRLPEAANAIVATAVNGRWGLADAARKWVLRPEFEAVTVVSGNRALAKSKGRWGVVDAAGKWLMEPRYRSLQALNEHLLIASSSEVELEQAVLLDDEGTALAPDPLPRAAEPFDGAGMAAARVEEGKWGWLDRKGQWAIAPGFDDVLSFNGQAAPARAPLPRSEPTPPTLQPWVVQSTWSWPSVKLAGAVRVDKAPQGTEARIGLMDEQGRWLVPNAAYWTPVK